jgi:hypothetical protein
MALSIESAHVCLQSLSCPASIVKYCILFAYGVLKNVVFKSFSAEREVFKDSPRALARGKGFSPGDY